MDSEERGLTNRFKQIYSEGLISAPLEHRDLPSVQCLIRLSPERQFALVRFEDTEALDSVAFCRKLFDDRGYVVGPSCGDGWESFSFAERPREPFIALKDNLALVNLATPWQPFVANYAINRVLRLQRDVVFFHASSVEIGGRGIMLVGPKGSGKTTTAMTLAGRGGSLGGDEITPVCLQSGTLLPFRRAVSVKSGPSAERVRELLAKGSSWTEAFPDGTIRTLAHIRDLFPWSRHDASRLCSVFFLEPFRAAPHVRPFAFGREHYPLLTPLAASMWGVLASVRMLQIARLLNGVPCFFLACGEPDATADLIERTVLEYTP